MFYNPILKKDNRVTYYMVIDTETATYDESIQVIRGTNMLVYDLGYAIVDKRGRIYETGSYIVKEIFYDEIERMRSCYFADKRSDYIQDIEYGLHTVINWKDLIFLIQERAKFWGVRAICAYNARFDVGAICRTNKYLSGKYWTPPILKNYPVWDIMKMTQDTLYKRPTYQQFCFTHGNITKHKTPRAQVKAETVKRYMENNPTYVECHTGLEDVLIEAEILAKCFGTHKKMRREL